MRRPQPSPGMSHWTNPHTREGAFALFKRKLDDRRMHGELPFHGFFPIARVSNGNPPASGWPKVEESVVPRACFPSCIGTRVMNLGGYSLKKKKNLSQTFI